MAFWWDLTGSTTIRQIWLLHLGSVTESRAGEFQTSILPHCPSLALRKHCYVQTVLHTSVAGVAGAEDGVAEVNPVEIRGRGLVPHVILVV